MCVTFYIILITGLKMICWVIKKKKSNFVSFMFLKISVLHRFLNKSLIPKIPGDFFFDKKKLENIHFYETKKKKTKN